MAMILSGMNRAEDFIKLCSSHIELGRARGFAFLFDCPKTRILRKAKVSTSLRAFDEIYRASGSLVTTFYVKGFAESEGITDYQDQLLKLFDAIELEPQIRPPFILFFRLSESKGEFIDIEILKLDSDSRDQCCLLLDIIRGIEMYSQKLSGENQTLGRFKIDSHSLAVNSAAAISVEFLSEVLAAFLL